MVELLGHLQLLESLSFPLASFLSLSSMEGEWVVVWALGDLRFKETTLGSKLLRQSREPAVAMESPTLNLAELSKYHSLTNRKWTHFSCFNCSSNPDRWCGSRCLVFILVSYYSWYWHRPGLRNTVSLSNLSPGMGKKFSFSRFPLSFSK